MMLVTPVSSYTEHADGSSRRLGKTCDQTCGNVLISTFLDAATRLSASLRSILGRNLEILEDMYHIEGEKLCFTKNCILISPDQT